MSSLVTTINAETAETAEFSWISSVDRCVVSLQEFLCELCVLCVDRRGYRAPIISTAIANDVRNGAADTRTTASLGEPGML